MATQTQIDALDASHANYMVKTTTGIANLEAQRVPLDADLVQLEADRIATSDLVDTDKASTGEASVLNLENYVGGESVTPDAGIIPVADANGKLDAGVIPWYKMSRLNDYITRILCPNKLVDRLSGELSWTRSTGATFINRHGQLKYSPSNYATNLFEDSEPVSGSVLGIQRCTYEGPLGQFPTSVQFDSAGTAYFYHAITSEIGKTYTVSIFVEMLNGRDIRGEDFHRSGYQCPFYLRVGAGDNKTTNVTHVEGNVYRVSRTFTCTSDATWSQGVMQYAGANAKWGGFRWTGFQMEESPVANAYIKTTTGSFPASGTSQIGISQAREEKQGWLFEGAGTNHHPDSEDASSSVWWYAKSRDLELNTATAPNGTLTADKVIPNVGGKDGLTGSPFTNNLGEPVSVSGFFKEAGSPIIYLGGKFGSESSVIDLSTGTLVFQQANVLSTRIIKLPDSWYWVGVTYTFQNRIGNNHLYSGLNAVTKNYGVWTEGNGVDGVYVWGLQYEKSPFPTSYIPTNGAAATRADDNVSIQTQGNHLGIGFDSAMSLFMNFELQGISNNAVRLFTSDEAHNGSARYHYAAIQQNYGRIQASYGGGGSLYTAAYEIDPKVQYSFTLTNDSDLYETKAYINDKVSTHKNPNHIINGSSGAKLVAPTLAIGSYLAGNSYGSHLNGWLSDFRIYPFALDETEIKILSGV